MFIEILAITFVICALIAAFKMDSALQGFLFILVLCIVAGVFYLFISFPGLSGLSVAIILAAFIFRQNKR